MILFLALCFFGVAIAGITAFAIFWPLALVHLRDRHPQVGEGLPAPAFLHPVALWWLLGGDYRQVRDSAFTGLATPARVALATLLLGLLVSGLLWTIGSKLA
ncbi:MAG: hypothetical protein Q4F49_00495 [Pseudoxanthomonas suwonensis]|nr:hypothetical protein [Pseudoxanthomonas suwonensis]